MRSWLALVACEACLFPSLDGLSSSDSGGPDGSDATSDVIVDASDAGATDAASDAGFCATHATATFCDDFDEATTLSPGWTNVSVVGDASAFAIVQDAPLSAPNAVRSSIGANTNSGQAFVGRHVPISSGQTLSFGVAMRADDWAAGPYASLTNIYTDQTHAAGIVLGYNNKSPLLVVDDDDGGTSTYPVSFPQSGWFHLTFVLAVSGASSTIDVLVEGQTTIGGPKPGPPISFGDVVCYIGLYASDYPSTLTWSFDDAYAEVK